jgi:hypothetical protein
MTKSTNQVTKIVIFLTDGIAVIAKLVRGGFNYLKPLNLEP